MLVDIAGRRMAARAEVAAVNVNARVGEVAAAAKIVAGEVAAGTGTTSAPGVATETATGT